MSRTWVDVPAGTTAPSGALTLSATNLNAMEADIAAAAAAAAAAAPAAKALYIVPYQTTVPTRPAYPGPVVIQIPDAQKGNVTFGGTTAGGAGLVDGLDFVWTS